MQANIHADNISEIDRWYEAIPEKSRAGPPRDLMERIEYDQWMI
jgi:hypothetical protein